MSGTTDSSSEEQERQTGRICLLENIYLSGPSATPPALGPYM